MRQNKIQGALFALGLLVMVLSACTPLLTPAQQTAVAATGQAAANGLLTAAPATQTLVPATPTAAITSTAVSAGVPVTGGTAVPATVTPATGIVPNTGATATAIPATQGTVSPTGCSGPLNVSAGGPIATLWIKNDTSTPMNFTMGLPTANSLGQCGYLTWGPIPAGKDLRVQVPVTQTALGDSCYWAYAVTADQGRQSIVTGSSAGYCIATPQRWVINVHSDRIRLVGP